MEDEAHLEALLEEKKLDCAILIQELCEATLQLRAQNKLMQAVVKEVEIGKLIQGYEDLFGEEYNLPLPPLRPEPQREGSALVVMFLD
jgi:hypothetical protein